MALAILLATCAMGVYAPAQLAPPTALGLGEATVAAPHVWGAGANPAAGPDGGRERAFAMQAYGLSLVGPAPLTRLGIDLSYAPGTSPNRFEIGAQHFAPPGYAVSALRFGARRRLARALYVGIRVGGLYGDYGEYGTELLPIAEGGLQYAPTRSLAVGAHYSYVQRDVSALAQNRLRVGIAYRSSPQVRWLAAVAQAVGEPLNGQVGIDYAPAERLCLSAGYQTVGQRLSFGTAYELGGGLRLGLAVVVYPRLPTGVGWGVGR